MRYFVRYTYDVDDDGLVADDDCDDNDPDLTNDCDEDGYLEILTAMISMIKS